MNGAKNKRAKFGYYITKQLFTRPNYNALYTQLCIYVHAVMQQSKSHLHINSP